MFALFLFLSSNFLRMISSCMPSLPDSMIVELGVLFKSTSLIFLWISIFFLVDRMVLIICTICRTYLAIMMDITIISSVYTSTRYYSWSLTLFSVAHIKMKVMANTSTITKSIIFLRFLNSLPSDNHLMTNLHYPYVTNHSTYTTTAAVTWPTRLFIGRGHHWVGRSGWWYTIAAVGRFGISGRTGGCGNLLSSILLPGSKCSSYSSCYRLIRSINYNNIKSQTIAISWTICICSRYTACATHPHTFLNMKFRKLLLRVGAVSSNFLNWTPSLASVPAVESASVLNASRG